MPSRAAEPVHSADYREPRVVVAASSTKGDAATDAHVLACGDDQHENDSLGSGEQRGDCVLHDLAALVRVVDLHDGETSGLVIPHNAAV